LAEPQSPTKKDSTSRRFTEARALQEKGSLQEARKLYESLLPDLLVENNNADLARALNELSVIASAQGHYDTAIAKARESADIYHKLGEKKREARATNNIGVAQLYRADYQPAMEHFQQALALYRDIGDHEGEIETLNNTGSVFFFEAKYLDALRMYQSAMDRVDRASEEPWYARRRQITISNLATLFQRLGREDRALQFYKQLQDSSEALTPSERARLLTNVGAIYRRLGDPLKALETYRGAQRLFVRDQHTDGELGVLKNIGIVLALDLDNLSGASEAFKTALAIAQRANNRREAMQAHLYLGESLYRMEKPRRAKQEFETALAIAKELSTTEEKWKALYGLGRTALLTGDDDVAVGYFREAIGEIESVRSGLQLLTLKSDFFADKRDVYDALIRANMRKPDNAELLNLMERSRARTFQDRLRPATSKGPATLAGLSILKDVQSRLDDSTLLLEFWTEPRTIGVVWITHSNSGTAWRDFSEADFREVTSFLKELPGSTEQEWRAHSQSLGKIILSGIEPLERPEIKHLVIVADGTLSFVPFDLLQAGNSGSLLIERFDISYLPMAVFLLRDALADDKSWRVPWSRELVAFGDPKIPSQPDPLAKTASEGETQERLPKSAEEVRAIARISRGRSELHLGADDLKKYLLQGKAKGATLLHLSTHATVDAENPERSRILFSPENDGKTPDYLFLREAYDLDLRGINLTTLSACDTERGRMILGEGVQSFSRALLSAGSRATVTTLWRVDDQPTAEFMKQFYYALEQGKSNADALRQAKVKFLHSSSDLRHPRHWAAFVLTGDGRHSAQRAISWNALLLPFAGFLVILSLVVRRFGAIRPRHSRMNSAG